jgi:putative peptidoglycan lipid II flippase
VTNSDEQSSQGAEAPRAADGAASTSVARSAALVTAGILISRVFGLLRQRATAHYFGTSGFADVITAAFRLGNTTQNLLGEGTLSATFIPLYARLRAAGRGKEAVHFALSCLGLLLVAVALASVLGPLLAPWLRWTIAAGFDAARLESTTRVVRIVFPMTGLMVLSAWALGVLNAHGRFFLPYAAPVAWNLAQIAGLVVAAGWLRQRDEALALALAWSALIGAALQLALLLPAVRRLLGTLRPRLDTRDPNVREATAKLPSVVFARGVIQISGLVDTLLVSFLGAGANAAFGYAQTVYLLPMSLLGTGEAAAALPTLVGEGAEQDPERRNAKLRATLGASLRRLVILALPATAVFLALGRELITVLLQTGSFDRAAVSRVEPLVMAYGFALLGNASGRILATTSFAMGDTKTPARFAIVRVVSSTVISLALMRSLGVLGVVLGAVIAAWIETAALALTVRSRIGGLGLGGIPLARVLALAAFSVLPSVAVRAFVPSPFLSTRLGALCLLVLAAPAFLAAARLLGLLDLRALLRRR